MAVRPDRLAGRRTTTVPVADEQARSAFAESAAVSVVRATMKSMIDHFGIVCADYEKSTSFYDAVLGVLGYTRQMEFGPAIGYGRGGKPDFWIEDGADRQVGAAIHFAFQAAGVDEVAAFYDAATALGAESLHAPRLWPEYHPGYFGAFVRDPDGNNVEAVFHGATA
jgi:catechol 2,3-dioxygenase-like lactoylglutathione lyase family enzyme